MHYILFVSEAYKGKLQLFNDFILKKCNQNNLSILHKFYFELYIFCFKKNIYFFKYKKIFIFLNIKKYLFF